MWSIWNAPSDLDYYGQSGFSGDEPDEEEIENEPEPPEDLPDPPDDGVEPPEEQPGEQP
jgi:hypothetical protein